MASHKVHQYEQIKFFNKPAWEYQFESVGGAVGCLVCGNPNPDKFGNTLMVQVKAQYKRTNWSVKDVTIDPPRNHCIFPKRGKFWTRFNSNIVIEPDVDWLGGYKDKPIYDSARNLGGDICLPVSIAGGIADNGTVSPWMKFH